MVDARAGAAGVLLSLLLAGCASPVQVAPASLVPLSAPAADFIETKYIRSSVSFGVMVGRVILEPETPDKAKAELNSLSYTGAPVAASK